MSGVAHELNNPLATILTWSERLTQRPALEPTVRRGLEVILGESERAARIVRNLLTFARKRQTTRAMVDVNQVVRETLALRSYEQRVTNITVIDALAAGLPQVFVDGHQVQQVLLNLVINAEQAMLSANGRRHSGRPYLARRRTRVCRPRDQRRRPGSSGAMCRPKIFDPFFTTKDVGKGTGLGLTVAYAIVKRAWRAHPARVAVRTQARRSSSSCRSPGARLPAHTPTASAPCRDRGSRASILVVDDEAALAAAVVRGAAGRRLSRWNRRQTASRRSSGLPVERSISSSAISRCRGWTERRSTVN
ncbi:MAG: histidine kinase dimerization/phospho-acceptor domain-containing protein [Vicinamibacterales bacterium]